MNHSYTLFSCSNDSCQGFYQVHNNLHKIYCDPKCPFCENEMSITYDAQKITKNDVVKRQYIHQIERDALVWFWRFSPLWKAIDNYIQQSPKNECCIFDKCASVSFNRSSSGVTLKTVYVYPAGSDDENKNVVRFCFNVDLYDEEDGIDRTSSGQVDVPLSFVENFDEGNFEVWLEGQRKNFLKRQLEDHKRIVQKIILKFAREEDLIFRGLYEVILKEINCQLSKDGLNEINRDVEV